MSLHGILLMMPHQSVKLDEVCFGTILGKC